MPLNGLIVEATDDYHERTRLAGVVLAFGFAAQIGIQWIFPLVQSSFFSSSITGVRYVSFGCGVLFLIAALVPVLFCRERLYEKVTARQAPVRFWASLRAASDNRAFMSLLCARGVFSFGYNVVGMLSGYMQTYYVMGGDIRRAAPMAATLGSSFHVAAILMSLLVYPRVERRIGKRRTMQVACWVLVIDCIAKYWLYKPGCGWLPIGVIVMNGIASSGVSLMCIAMLQKALRCLLLLQQAALRKGACVYRSITLEFEHFVAKAFNNHGLGKSLFGLLKDEWQKDNPHLDIDLSVRSFPVAPLSTSFGFSFPEYFVSDQPNEDQKSAKS